MGTLPRFPVLQSPPVDFQNNFTTTFSINKEMVAEKTIQGKASQQCSI